MKLNKLAVWPTPGTLVPQQRSSDSSLLLLDCSLNCFGSAIAKQQAIVQEQTTHGLPKDTTNQHKLFLSYHYDSFQATIKLHYGHASNVNITIKENTVVNNNDIEHTGT